MPRFKNVDIESLALQILDHLKTATYTAENLAQATGAHHHQVVDALTWLMGTGRVYQDLSPRYSLLRPGDSSPYYGSPPHHVESSYLDAE